MTRTQRTTNRKQSSIPQAARRRLAVLAGAFPGCSHVEIRCSYCGLLCGWASWPKLWKSGRPGAWVSFSGHWRGVDIDHIVPREHGGPTTLTNLAISCRTCNRSKGHMHICEWQGIA